MRRVRNPILVPNYGFLTLYFSSEKFLHFKRDQTECSIKPALLCQAPTILGTVEDKASSVYFNNFFCYIMSGLRGVRAVDMEDIK